MSSLTNVTSRVIPLLVDNIDTDQIIPARFLKATDKNGFGELLFSDWRYRSDGTPDPAFPLNEERHRGARILLAGANFGCGSSREHAPWALTAFGFQAVVSTSFADIFKSNAMKNGLLPVVLTPAEHERLVAELRLTPDGIVTIDIEAQQLTAPSGAVATFPIDAFAKHCLMNGVDELDYLRRFSGAVESYEAVRGW
jgi:3-isopropylmalate/(R)-2-methylmalate dehydratase small subunit